MAARKVSAFSRGLRGQLIGDARGQLGQVRAQRAVGEAAVSIANNRARRQLHGVSFVWSEFAAGSIISDVPGNSVFLNNIRMFESPWGRNITDRLGQYNTTDGCDSLNKESHAV